MRLNYVRFFQGRLLTWNPTFVFRPLSTDCRFETLSNLALIWTPPQAAQLLALDHVNLRGSPVVQMPLAIQRLHTKVPANERCEIHTLYCTSRFSRTDTCQSRKGKGRGAEGAAAWRLLP